MKTVFMLTLLLLIGIPGWGNDGKSLYSVSEIINSLNEKEGEHHKTLKIKPPEVLYHWISVKSAMRLFHDDRVDKPFPLKVLGDDLNQPQLTYKVPGFYKKKGLFVWHNPIGATIGGSGEIYGQNEAVLGLKIKPAARVGLIVTLDNFEPGSGQLLDPAIVNKYDLILHASGLFFDSQFSHSTIEWVIVNPEIISEYTLDSEIIKQEMNLYEKVLEGRKSINNKPIIEMIAGPQHTGLGAFAIDSNRVRELKSKITINHKHLQKLPISQGWHSRKNSCLRVIKKKGSE